MTNESRTSIAMPGFEQERLRSIVLTLVRVPSVLFACGFNAFARWALVKYIES